MKPCDDDDRLPCAKTAAQGSFPVACRPDIGRICACLFCLAAVFALAGCGFHNGPGSLLVDPGRYSVLHCKDLVDEWQKLVAREQELRNLQNRASEAAGGAVIGTIAYRADFETVLADEKMVQREAAGQNCALVHTYTSDQTIR